MINKKSKIYIAGHKGMVGSSLIRLFQKKGYTNLLTRTKKQLNLLDQSKVYAYLKKQKPDALIIAAARVGGIYANNKFRADFLYQNLQIQNNLIHGSYLAGVKKLIFLGSSCIYPKNSKQPIKEEYLLTSELEYTNEPYAIAKIAGLKMCENYNKQFKTNFICLMPCNLYGKNDNYDVRNSHFLPAVFKKILDAKKNNKKDVVLWGNGKPKRELLFVDDLARACIFFLKKKTQDRLINIGSGEEYSIKQYAIKISKLLNYKCNFIFDTSMPNGTMRKLLDSSLAKKYGWTPETSFDKGMKITIEDYLKYKIN